MNIALFSGVETGLPVMIRIIPGSVKDIKTLIPSMDEIKVTDTILILDRGFVSDEVMNEIFERNCSAVVPQRRNSNWYNERIHLNDRFLYHKRFSNPPSIS